MGLLDDAFRRGIDIVRGYRHRGLDRSEHPPQQRTEEDDVDDGPSGTVSMLPDLTPIAHAIAGIVGSVAGAIAIGVANLALGALVVAALTAFFAGFGAALWATITGTPVVLPILGVIVPAVGIEILAVAGFALTWLVLVPVFAVATVIDARRSRRTTGLEHPPPRRNSAPFLAGIGFAGAGIAGAYVQFQGIATFALLQAFAVAWPAMLGLALFSFWVWWKAEQRSR